jgi:hypothetical protein
VPVGSKQPALGSNCLLGGLLEIDTSVSVGHSKHNIAVFVAKRAQLFTITAALLALRVMLSS